MLPATIKCLKPSNIDKRTQLCYNGAKPKKGVLPSRQELPKLGILMNRGQSPQPSADTANCTKCRFCIVGLSGLWARAINLGYSFYYKSSKVVMGKTINTIEITPNSRFLITVVRG